MTIYITIERERETHQRPERSPTPRYRFFLRTRPDGHRLARSVKQLGSVALAQREAEVTA